MAYPPPGDASPIELLRALAVFAEPPTGEHAAVARALDLGEAPAGDAYAQLFSFQLYPYASVHLGGEGMMGGDAADRVAGFWRAVGQTPPAEPDHLSALLGLYASLLEAEETLRHAAESDGAAGDHSGDRSGDDSGDDSGDAAGDGAVAVDPTEAVSLLAGRSRAALLHEHLTPWVFAFLDRVQELDGAFYGRWAGLLMAVLEAETTRAPTVDVLPAHLRDAPGLADPRLEGGKAFLEGLLAPVRTGMILTRADLARIARDMDIGLRMGERRYVLESFLGQEPVKTLEHLAREADAWQDRHTRMLGTLGASGAFWVSRAESSAALLRDLAAAGEDALMQAAEPTT